MPLAPTLVTKTHLPRLAAALLVAVITVGSAPQAVHPSAGAIAPSSTPSPVAEATPAATPLPSPPPSASATARRTAAPLSASLVAAGRDAWSATLQLAVPSGVSRLQILRNGRLLDDIPVQVGPLAYTDYLLWPATGYSYEVRWLTGQGTVVSDQRFGVTTPHAAGPFHRLYGPGSFWNQPIGANPAIDPASGAMVARALVPYGADANLANSAEWGKPLAYANAISRSYAIGCSMYGCDTQVDFRVPSYAVPNQGSDHHLVVIDASTSNELDMWLSAPAAGGWSAGSRYTTAANGWGAICASGQRCGGADAAGFALMGGVIRPEEIAQGHIDHALFFTTPYTRSGYVACPATNTDGQADDPSAIPEGARIQLDPAFNVDAQAWPRWEKVVAHALQTYGAYLGDTGGSLALFGEANLDRGYDAWSLAGAPIGPSLAALPWQNFRVLQLQSC